MGDGSSGKKRNERRAGAVATVSMWKENALSSFQSIIFFTFIVSSVGKLENIFKRAMILPKKHLYDVCTSHKKQSSTVTNRVTRSQARNMDRAARGRKEHDVFVSEELSQRRNFQKLVA